MMGKVETRISLNKCLMVLTVLTLLSLKGAETLVREEYSCDPVNDCTSLGVGAKVPDPDLCDHYYLCITDGSTSDAFPSDNSVACPEGQYFNFAKGNCTDEGEESCKDLCLNICNLSCRYAGDVVAIPNDCSRYYFCTDGNSLLISCPIGQVFNGTACDNDQESCCDTCSAFCEMAFTQTMDPYDCNSYYLCPARGVPDDSDKYSCESGEYFEPEEGKCVVEEETCTSLCSE